MDKRTYLAIFEPADADEGGGYTVTFPDVPGCITEGDTLDEAMHHAKEALELQLWGLEHDGDILPTPSRPEQIALPTGAIVVPIDAWMDLTREEMAHQSVNTMVTLPRWLKEMAMDRRINFSHVLQQAVKERLGLADKSQP